MKPFEVRAVGVTAMDGYPDNLLDLAVLVDGTPLEASLIREPTNPVDVNAVFVLAGGRKIGYLPANFAAVMCEALDGGLRTRCEITVLVNEDHPERPGALVRVEPVPQEAGR